MDRRHQTRRHAKAFESVGDDGVITLEESKGVDTSLKIVQGLQFDKGYISPYFITDPAEMVEAAPKVLKEGASKADCEAAQKDLEEAGATVALK